MRHTRPNLPGRGTSPQRSQCLLSSQADDWTSGSPLESTGGVEGVPLADEAASPSSTALAGLPSSSPGGERREVRGGPRHRCERLRTHCGFTNSRRLLRGGLDGRWVDITGLVGAVRQPGRRLRQSDETRERPHDSQPATAHAGFVAVDSRASVRTRVGDLLHQARW